MDLRRQSSGEFIRVDTASPLGKGGEAQVYAVVGDTTLAAKVYEPNKAMSERMRKLAVMCAHPPDVLPGKDGHVSIAWPMDLLCDVEDAERVVGFLMGRVQNASQVIDVYNPQNRLRESPLFDYRYLLRTARNLAAAVRALHARGYVIGDLKHSNVLVTQTALVTLVDTDSFQVRDPQTGHIFACPVRTPDFTPPELQETGEKTQKTGEKEIGEEDTVQNPEVLLEVLLPEHDLFALGVLVFHLLMEGTHPFAGVYLGEGDPPPFEERIAQGHFPLGTRTVPYRPSTRHAPPFDMLPPTLRELFLRCFEDGHTDPAARPDARTWQAALDQAGRMLSRCADNPQHFYSDHLAACPWCERRQTQLRGIDPFPSEQAVQDRNKAAEAANTTSQTTNPSPDTHHAPLDYSLALLGKIAAGAFGLFCICMFCICIGSVGQLTRYSTVSSDPQSAETASVQQDYAYSSSPILNTTEKKLPFVPAVAISRDGKYFAVSATIRSVDKITLHLWNTVTLREKQMEGHTLTVNSLAFAPDGTRLASGSDDGTIRVWSVPDGKNLLTLSSRNKVLAVAFSPDGRELVTGSATHEDPVNIWDSHTGEHLRALAGDFGDVVRGVCFSPDGQRIASVGNTIAYIHPGEYAADAELINLWDAKTGQGLARTTQSGQIKSVVFTRDNKRLITQSETNLRVWDAKTLVPVGRADIGPLEAFTLFPDEKTLIVAGAHEGIAVYNANPIVKRKIIPTDNNGLIAAGGFPDGETLLTGSVNKGAQIWNIRTGRLKSNLLPEADGITSPAP